MDGALRLQALTHDILPKKLPESNARSVCRTQTPSTGLPQPSFLGGSCRKAMLGVFAGLKLQALVYHSLPSLEEAAGKQCLECVCVCRFFSPYPPPHPPSHTRTPTLTILTHLEAGPGTVYLLAIFLPLGEGRGVGLHGTHQLRVLTQLGRVPVLGLAAQLGGTCTCNTHKQ